MSRSAVQLVLFDLDGTLVETAPEIRDALDDTLHALGLPPAPLEQVETWIGQGTGTLLLRALSYATGVAPEELRATNLWRAAQPRFAVDYERRCGTTSRLVPHARDVLRALGQRGVRRALITNKERRFTFNVLHRHGLRPLLDRVVCGDTLPQRKPDPAGVLDCLQAFDVPAQRAVLVGDSATDVATARNAGIPVWALAHGYNQGEPIAAAAPDRVLDSLCSVLR